MTHDIYNELKNSLLEASHLQAIDIELELEICLSVLDGFVQWGELTQKQADLYIQWLENYAAKLLK